MKSFYSKTKLFLLVILNHTIKIIFSLFPFLSSFFSRGSTEIAMVCSTGAIGGAETVFIEHVLALKDKFKITVYFSENGGALLERLNHVNNIVIKIRPNFLDIKLLGFQYVYLAQVIPDLEFIKKISPITKFSFIFHDAVLWPIQFKNRNDDIYKLDRVFCISNQIKNSLMLTFDKLDANNVIVLRNSVQHAKNKIKGINNFDEKSRRKPHVLGFAGRFSPEKNILGLIKSFQLFRETCPEVRLRIAGDISLKDNFHLLEYKKEISELIENDSSIEYLGHVSNLDDFYHSIDILVLSSFIEGVSVAAIDALAYGVPVVTTDVGAMGEIIQDGFNGFLFDLDFIRPNPFDNYKISFTDNEVKGFASVLEKALNHEWSRDDISRFAGDHFCNEKIGLLLYDHIISMINHNGID